MLRESPPANPFVRELWQDQELLPDDDSGPSGGSPGELEEREEREERGERE